MGNQVSMPAARAAPFAPNLTHKQRVTRLYRHALRTARDWEPDFDLFVKDAEKIQARFKKNKHLTIQEGQRLVEAGLKELIANRHPEPYIPPFAPGGTAYQRNIPCPPEDVNDLLPPPERRIR
ncbi:hypothetical protein GpartN1_g571.t1 [Galdieria partita]|uniref:NADH dehydrogenase [ubiquinone] 1 beta subcomplex subunit 9 n=1 Tax=Galdieria partita TaxID=83374 RepID=A0A9C7PQQ2_9RHOD|nr:hypothetical protein GpartN1_g571.t1 [Galdieria partita]